VQEIRRVCNGHEEHRHRLPRWGHPRSIYLWRVESASESKEDEESGIGDARSRRRFEICGLSGTSAGALNAFMVWYGMMLKDGM
jgi:hypothetical protein